MNPGREYPANPRGQCMFYKNGLCSIHEVKPFECKEYICGSDIEDVKNRHKSVAMEWNTEKNQEQIVGLLGCQPISQAYLSSLNDYKYF